ncbi:MAG TPA: cytochrome c [Bacteroidota bacterium]|nr:cytochrome c [Bacteroidota bacterium]
MALHRCWMLCVFIFAGTLYAQQIDLPQNPLQGRMVFEEKGCIECHAIGGYGGTAGPSLSSDLYFGSVLELATIIWNHTPQMNRKFRQMRMERPQFSEKEMLDLFGFLYYLRYLGEPGGVAKGKKVLESKGCTTCHSIGGGGGSVGDAFDSIKTTPSPLYIVQSMWNHVPGMREQIEKAGLNFPMLTGQDITDITVYIRQAALTGVEAGISPGDPKNGKEVFESKGCNQCHVAEGEAKKILAPNLSQIRLKKSVTETASLMWNHGPMMAQKMKDESIEWPKFEGNEMADMIAYLYFLDFEDKPGDGKKGGAVFQSKGCSNCHEKGGSGRGPDIMSITHFNSPVRMIQLMWNHAAGMEDMLITQNKKWPALTSDEMRNLYSYLRESTKP